MMEIWQSVILGIVEGITEFLPISSTGHLILAGNLLGIEPSGFSKSFDIVIQLGAIASVVFLYWRKIWQGGTIKKLITAFIPTGIVSLLFYKIVKTYLLGSTAVVLWALALGGVTLIVFEIWYRRKNFTAGENEGDSRARITKTADQSFTAISYKQALTIGLFQSVAIIPGVSRAAATILGGLFLGLNRVIIVEFSFLLAVPTMLAASGLDLALNYSSFSFAEFGALALGFAISFFVALGSIKFLLRYIQSHNFIAFGIYRIALAVLFFLVLL